MQEAEAHIRLLPHNDAVQEASKTVLSIADL